MRRLLPILISAALPLLTGCPGPTPEGCGELAWTEGGAEVSVNLTTFCEAASTRLELRNVGNCPVELAGLEHVSGDPVSFGGAFTEGAPFRIEPEFGRIAPGEAVSVTVARDTWKDHTRRQAQVRLRGTHGEDVLLELEAVNVSGSGFDIPHTIDFGAVAVGDVGYGGWQLWNPTREAETWFVGAPEAADAESSPFSLAPGSSPGELVVGRDETRDVNLLFSPDEVGSFEAVQRIVAPLCDTELEVKLKGQGVASVLAWSPLQLDCGAVPPEREVQRQVTFANRSARPVQLSNLRPTNPQDFGIVTPPGEDETRLTVPAATLDETGAWVPGEAALTIACHPAVAGYRQATLTFDTDLPKQPTGSVSLRVLGGGPEIEVSPSPNLNFGKVAYFEFASPPVFVKRKLSIVNVGTAPAAPDVRANLRLGQVDPTTGDVNATFVKITPLNGATTAGEFEVRVPATYDPGWGLEAKAGANRVDLEVTFTPTSFGLKQAELTIYSTDFDEPEVKVVVSADAVMLPPCDYTITPPSLAFGLFSPPDPSDLSFTITNNGNLPGDVCLLSGLSVTAESSHVFSLPQGEIEEPVELQPQERREIPVRAWLQGTAPVGITDMTGRIEFNISSPLRPVGQVALAAQLGPRCLTLAPRRLDFGTTKAGCRSAKHQVRVYNHCSSSVSIQSVASTAPEFTISGLQLGTGGTPLAAGDPPLTFDVSYKATALGSASAALKIAAIQSGKPVTYWLPLEGSASLNGLATDTFSFDVTPEFDVLLVIDDTLGNDPAAVAAAAGNFAHWANTTGTDLHVTVTTSDMSVGGAQGEFLAGASHPQKVLGPSTLAALLPTKLAVGSGGFTHQCLAAAAAALSDPLRAWSNAGFLRPDATLAVVCMGSQPDASPLTHGWYLDFLRNLKDPGKSSAFSFNAVSGFTSACDLDDGTLEAAADLTGGFKQDVCTLDWDDVIFGLQAREARSREVVDLRAIPDLQQGPVEVAIDGVNLPASTGSTTVWTYDPTKNRIVFTPLNAPEPGKTVTVTYPVFCQL